MSMSKPILHIIAGPTACGKTAAAINLAHKIDAEIVSVDSMQIYKGMDIGTAKPTAEEMQGIPHHMLDVVAPDEYFSVADYTRLAAAAIEDIISRGKTPILAGGTGFYINAVLYGAEFTEAEEGQHEKDNQLRQFYTAAAKEKGSQYIHEKLQAVDPASAEAIHPNNIKRVARALAFCEATGSLFSVHNAIQKQKFPRYEAIVQLIDIPRETLYNRINARVVTMWDAGLPEEVAGLLAKGYAPNLASMQGIGYKETIPYLRGSQTKEEAIAQIQQATRNYAKRQDTWFRHQMKSTVVR